MAIQYDLLVKGPDGQDAPNPMTPGVNGLPLGPAGNGAPGTKDMFGKCEKPAGPGLPGNKGVGAPPAESGENGTDAYAVKITCGAFNGNPVSLLVSGGNGGMAGSGGVGGNGGDGGNAGTQPKSCTGVISGGMGGPSGVGGTAGNGGDAGKSADVSIIYGPQITTIPVSAKITAGTPRNPGNPGDPGTPGKGGLNSDGTHALPGGQAGSGGQGNGGKQGYTGAFNSNMDPSQAPTYVSISIVPPTNR